MRKVLGERDQVLKKIALAFSRHRRRNGGRASYSRTLRALAVSSVEQGAAPDKVAKAAGISLPSLKSWQRCDRVESPRELRLVPGGVRPGIQNPIASEENLVARIRLASGVSIEIPLKSLTCSLIATLSGGGPE